MKIDIAQLEELRFKTNSYFKNFEKHTKHKCTLYEKNIELIIVIGDLMTVYTSKLNFWDFDTNTKYRDLAIALWSQCLIFIHYIKGEETYEYCEYNPNNIYENIAYENIAIPELVCSILDVNFDDIDARIFKLIILGFKLGFTWEEMYNATLNKLNSLNVILENRMEDNKNGKI